ncbi:MAG: helix-turn-helix domain-containing protein [Haloarculaceae archaeon]
MSAFAEVRVPVTAYPLGTVFADHDDVTFQVERIVPMGGSTHYVWITGDDRAAVVSSLRETPSVTELTVLDELPDRTLVRFELPHVESTLFDLVTERDVTISEFRGTTEGWTLQLHFADPDELGRFYDECRERGISVELRQINNGDDPFEDEHEITPRQIEMLAIAYESGYFDVPRRTTLTDLAARLDISEQAASERLRRGLSSLLTTTVSGDETGDRT